jgi:IS30 family transposase
MPSRTSGAEGGPGKRIGSNPDTAPRSDPYVVGRYGRSHLITLVERHSPYLVALPIANASRANASSGTVITALAKTFAGLPNSMRKSLTWNRGIEMTRHEEFTWASGIPVYFCNAYSRGREAAMRMPTGLLRQYFPKRTDLSIHTPEQLQIAVEEINQRPRQTLNWHTVSEVFQTASVALIA